MAQELTEEVDQQLFRNESSVSLDKGLDQLVPPEKAIENVSHSYSISTTLAESESRMCMLSPST
jgi:hypothetical protein